MFENRRDYLTGLYTRQDLYILYEAMEPNTCFHMMFMDVDNFKNVNDVYGHNEGDVLLQAVAHILVDSAPTADAIRLGGDEFVLLFKGDYSKEELCNIANRIILRVNEKEGFEHITTHTSASIGILYAETVGCTLNEILLKSDRAMYYAKSHGKGCFVVYNDIADEMLTEIKMEQLQQKALENGDFEIYYLPIISAQSSKLRMSQARLVWNMPDGTVKPQEEFLPLFEKNGFIRQLNMWTIHTVFGHLRSFHESSNTIGHISVRISKLLLLEDDFAQYLNGLTNVYGIAPTEVTLEVDENAFTRGCNEMFCTIEALKLLGFCIAIVNVGSEFKSLAYWDKLDFDCIMFDRNYVKNTLSTPRGKQIFITLLTMGRQLKMQVIADGITTREEVLFLCNYGCNAISGSYYSEALPSKDYYAYTVDKLIVKEEKTEFDFLNSFTSKDGKYTGKLLNGNLEFAPGISNNWGSILCPGGSFQENVLELPGSILSESWTVCMWLKPLATSSWTSAFYAKYNKRFATFSPFVLGGYSVFRISDGTVNGYQDIFARQLHQDTWNFVCMTYDEASGMARSYFDGKNTGVLTDVPALPACRRIVLGGDPFQPSYQGYISGVMFFNQAKSEEEISELYQSFGNEPGFCGKINVF